MSRPSPDHELREDSGMPHWVKALGFVAFLVVVIIAAMLFVGGHGPGRHFG